MEEQALSAVLEAPRKGQCIVILDLESREAKTNLFFPIASSFIFFWKTLRTEVGGGLYIYVVHGVASTFGFPFIGEVSTTHPQLFFFDF
jgi:3,4-dihydroxy 2-butanone 4-phosphate synthase